MSDYVEQEAAPPAPPASYQASEESRPKKELYMHPAQNDDEVPPAKAAKHDELSYPGKDNAEQYSSIDFLGNVSGGPHAAAAEALATFSSSVGDTAHNAQLYVDMPQEQNDAPTSSATAIPQGPPFLCPTCNTSYSRLEYLRRHERRHADIRPFTCICGKSFSRSDVLARHKTKCRVALAGESEIPQSNQSARKAGQRGNAPRSSRTRGAARKQERGDVDLSVDPALSNAVDPSLEPPPPLEGGSTEADQVAYAYGGAPPTYAHHAQYSNEEYAHGKPGVHYPQGAVHANMQHRAHPGDAKMYAVQRGGASPYVSGPGAIHPELSSRAYSGSHTPTSTHGAASPNTTNRSASPYYGQTESAAHAAQPGAQPGTQASSSGNYPLNKEPARYSVAPGPLSSFSNTALNANMSPYLNTFSCARDIPHSSNPRSGTASGAPSSTPSQSGGNEPPSEH